MDNRLVGKADRLPAWDVHRVEERALRLFGIGDGTITLRQASEMLNEVLYEQHCDREKEVEAAIQDWESTNEDRYKDKWRAELKAQIRQEIIGVGNLKEAKEQIQRDMLQH